MAMWCPPPADKGEGEKRWWAGEDGLFGARTGIRSAERKEGRKKKSLPKIAENQTL